MLQKTIWNIFLNTPMNKDAENISCAWRDKSSELKLATVFSSKTRDWKPKFSSILVQRITCLLATRSWSWVDIRGRTGIFRRTFSRAFKKLQCVCRVLWSLFWRAAKIVERFVMFPFARQTLVCFTLLQMETEIYNWFSDCVHFLKTNLFSIYNYYSHFRSL